VSTKTIQIAAAEIPAALIAVPAQMFVPSLWPNADKPSSHRASGVAGAPMTDATFGLARRPRRIPL
jgi:hypothetical protein